VASPDLYQQHHAAIERAISKVCHKHHLSRTEAEDFGSVLRIHILENDRAVLRKFGERATMDTYLHAVAVHRFQDWRNAQWGKWRPSAEAKRMGPVAVQLETRLVRDQLPMNEAVQILQNNHGVTESREALETMAARFPVRHGRTFVGEDVLAMRPAANGDAGATLEASVATSAARQAADALEEIIRALDPLDRMILRMRFKDGRKIADIARDLDLEPKVLYRRLERVLAELKSALEARGITSETAREIFAHRGFELAESEIGPEPPDRVRPNKRRGRW
jgi:RNA polymerase sigma factor for flagellar operon FliA